MFVNDPNPAKEVTAMGGTIIVLLTRRIGRFLGNFSPRLVRACTAHKSLAMSYVNFMFIYELISTVFTPLCYDSN